MDGGAENRVELATKPQRCPVCGAGVARILWGMPDFNERLRRELEEGKVVLGGCVLSGDDPQWECRSCGQRIYRKGR